MTPHSRDIAALKRTLFWLPFGSILVIWALLYLPHLRTSPGWYGDEALSLSAALDLTHGIAAHRAMWNSFWHPCGPYQPLYQLLVGWGARLCGSDILGGRIVNTLFALAIALLLCLYGRPLVGVIPAWFSALLFLSYEQSVIHFRWMFTHNLVALGFCLTVLALARPSRLRNDFTAGIGLAIAAGALPIFLYGAVAAGLLRLWRPRSWIWIFGPPALMVAASLTAGAFLPAHNFLAGDLAAMVRFYGDASKSNSGGLAGAVSNFCHFFLQDQWHAIGLLMLLLALCRRYYAIGIGGLVVVILLVQNRQNLPLFYYQAVIFLPLMMFAYGVGLRRATCLLRRRGLRLTGSMIQALAVGVAFLAAVSMMPQSLTGTLKPRIQYWVTQSPHEVEEAAAWINARTIPADLVICNVNMAWLLHARTADYLEAATWEGWPTWPFDVPLPRAEFRYDADISKARFAVVGDIDERWTFSQPNVARFVQKFQTERWPIVWRGKTYLILANPAFFK